MIAREEPPLTQPWRAALEVGEGHVVEPVPGAVHHREAVREEERRVGGGDGARACGAESHRRGERKDTEWCMLQT